MLTIQQVGGQLSAAASIWFRYRCIFQMIKKNIPSTVVLIALVISALFNSTFAQLARKSAPEGVPAATAPSLGSASTFAVLGNTTVTNTGLSILTGNLGLSPGTSITGFDPILGPGIVLGTTYAAGAIPAQAQFDVGVAVTELDLQTCTNDMTGEDMGGQTITAGVNCFDTSAQLTGTLTLDGEGDPNAVFIFQIGSTLTSATGANIVLVNGATACNTFFSVGSSATLGTGTHFEGNLIARDAITLTTNVRVHGLTAARTEAVTLDTNRVATCAVLPPSAASVNVTGRVVSAAGRGIAGTRVTMTDSNANLRSTLTTSFGYYSFADVEVGQSLLISVSNKRFTFNEPDRLISLMDEVSNLDFVAN